MKPVVYTRHAEKRMRQRGMRTDDIALVLACGTQIDDDAYLLRDRDVRQSIEALQRLRNRKVVVREGAVVTAYPSRPEHRKRALRRGRRKGLME